MDGTTRDKIEGTLRENWDSLYPQILDRFSTVTKADISEALDTPDLVARITSKTGFDAGYVEGELKDLCMAGAGQPIERADNRVPFGHQHQESRRS